MIAMKVKGVRYTSAVFWAVQLVLCVSSCGVSSGGPEEENSPSGDVTALVSDKTPAEGWSGNMQNGVATYCPDVVHNGNDTDTPLQTYYAFSFEHATCKQAVYNVICPDERTASDMETAYHDGTWAVMSSGAHGNNLTTRSAQQLMPVTRGTTVSDLRELALRVYRSGRVLYVTVDNIIGCEADDIKSLVVYWEGKGIIVPNRLISGSLDESNGKYTHSNLLNLGIAYEVNTTYENDLLKTYTATTTFPNASWACALYEQMANQNKRILSRYNLNPTARLSGVTMTENATIAEQVTKDQMLQMISVIDWSMSRPFFVAYMNNQ